VRWRPRRGGDLFNGSQQSIQSFAMRDSSTALGLTSSGRQGRSDGVPESCGLELSLELNQSRVIEIEALVLLSFIPEFGALVT
jgi:hypothetical protein